MTILILAGLFVYLNLGLATTIYICEKHSNFDSSWNRLEAGPAPIVETILWPFYLLGRHDKTKTIVGRVIKTVFFGPTLMLKSLRSKDKPQLPEAKVHDE